MAGLFRRDHFGRGRLPREIVALAERAGRHAINPITFGDLTIWDGVMAPLLPLASTDPNAFHQALADACLPAQGLAAFGAAFIVYDFGYGLSDLRATTPQAQRIFDAAIEYLRQNFVPPMRVPEYLWRRWIDTGGNSDTWIPLNQRPSRENANIRPLQVDEVRPLVRLGDRSDSNTIVARSDGDEFVAMISYPATGDDQVPPFGWKRSPSLYDLYREVAWTTQERSSCDPEIEPFFPAPKCLI
jgi:hypothetical protein